MVTNLNEIVAGIELVTQDELHPVSQRLQNAELVGRCEQQGELADGDALRRSAPALNEDRLLVECEIESRLILFLDLVALVYEDDVLVMSG
jgi:hypothetical protein